MTATVSLLPAIAALASALAGFFSLSLAMDRHYEDSFGRGLSPGRRARWLQLGGAIGLVVSLVLCAGWRGVAQGVVLWCGVLTASAVLVALLLSYAPRLAVRVLAGAGAVALLALVGAWV